VLAQPRDRCLAFNHPIVVQHMGQRDSTDFLWHAVGKDPLQHRRGIGAADIEFGKGRQVGKCHAF